MKYSVAVLLVLLSACGPSNTPQSSETKAATATGGSSSCSARNEVGKDCKITCQGGQSAMCTNGAGSNEPTCACTPAK
jgi:hypothetical protein